MKIAIVGSRDYPNRQQVIDYVNSLPDDTVVISGGARGVDTWAEQAAKARGMVFKLYPANWRVGGVYNPGAGRKRNAQMVAACDKLVAFTIGSSGTGHSIGLAGKAGKLEHVFTPNSLPPAPEQMELF